ncbi:MAG: very short patch repair endonuclease [Verrucomicrobia bacterium]|nr:very short patch repair endonuclease [Verrucomicrobiota bacterium]
MVDHLTPEKRSWNMSRIRGKNTKPELIVRSLLHRMGYRFTVNGPLNKKLPGKPDIVLPKYRTVIFVHGCFWHRHRGCKGSTTPSTRREFWKEKLWFPGGAPRQLLIMVTVSPF